MITNKIKNILDKYLKDKNINNVNYLVEKSKNINFGDFTSNLAMILAKMNNQNPIDIANDIKDNIDKTLFKDIVISKPGFVNFFINDYENEQLIKNIIEQKDNFPVFANKNENINIEFVSANPTGLLHIGHARNAVFGDILTNLLKKIGYNVQKEYLINDAGNQMNKLAYSVLIRYLQLYNMQVDLIDDAYHGDEVILVAKELKNTYNDKFINTKIDQINGYILDKDTNEIIRSFACDFMLNKIKEHLNKLGVNFDLYFSEKNDHDPNAIVNILDKLKTHTYIKDDALWLNTTKLGDDKDRVLIKNNKDYTYFLPDIAYHVKKLTVNNPVKIINIWGADHHSYINRLLIALEYLGYKNKTDTIFLQMVRLLKDGKEFKISKRTGKALTLIDLYEMIGYDACRWFLISSNKNSHIEIDIDLANEQSNNNPIYYVQYAHARINTLLKKANFNLPNLNEIKLNKLNEDIEHDLINTMHIYYDTILFSANNYEPSKLTNFLLSFAKLFHNYYTNYKILNNIDNDLIQQRLLLLYCIKQIIKNALSILGIEAKEQM